MRFPARVFLRCLSFLLIFFLLLPTFTSIAHAQTPPPANYQFASPNVDQDVPHNQHTLIQSMFLEMLLALQCQLTGIDISNPAKSCLGVNLQTGKIGYAPSGTPQQQQGGLLGAVSQGIGMMYTPTVSSRDYIHYLSDNFGIVKQTHAANTAYTGFQGLQPILGIWKTTRDLSYYLLIIAFIFIGIGVMLRLKIDPRTVMTIQNQIPRVIICIILITFSYAFAGLMIDTMWAVTYMGINKLTENANPTIDTDDGHQISLRQAATNYLLESPFRYANEVYDTDGAPGGVLALGWGVGQAIGRLQNDIIVSLFLPSGVSTDCGITNIGGCTQLVFKWIFGFLWFFAVAVALLIALFRVWIELLKAYVMIILYVILAPIWIVFGLLPKRPLGFEKWLRVFFSNLAVFPAVVLILVGARVLHELFGTITVLGASTTMDGSSVLGTATQYRFVPPLVGNPDTNSFGAILEFAMVLMAPQLLNLIREKMGAPPNKQVGAAFQTFSAARGAVGAPVKQSLKHLNQKDSYGNAVGALAKWKEDRVNNMVSAGSRLPGVGGKIKEGHDKREYMKQHYNSIQGYQKGWQYKEDFKADIASHQGDASFAEKYTTKGKWDLAKYADAKKGAPPERHEEMGAPPEIDAQQREHKTSPTAGPAGTTPVTPTTAPAGDHATGPAAGADGHAADTQAVKADIKVTIDTPQGQRVATMTGGPEAQTAAFSFIIPGDEHKAAAEEAWSRTRTANPEATEQQHVQSFLQEMADKGHIETNHPSFAPHPAPPTTEGTSEA